MSRKQAFELCANEIAVVPTDAMMPYMDGPAFIHALRRMDPTIKILAASRLDADGKGAKMSEIGVKHFLTKPYSTMTLLKALQEVLRKS